jgi:hypothetical protein
MPVFFNKVERGNPANPSAPVSRDGHLAKNERNDNSYN